MATAKPNVWKVAPGRKAKFWKECRDSGSICIGWFGDKDFRDFKSRDEIRDALISTGEKGGGASSIWAFTRLMKPGDIVVANDGRSRIVGVGIVTSDYIPPTDPKNPSPIEKYRHARRVDWQVTQEFQLPEELFSLPTVTRIRTDQWDHIRQEYLAKRPELKSVFGDLETSRQDWRSALREWRKSHPRTAPQALLDLRQAFVTAFPSDQLASLTLERYALGHEGYKDSFCYWLEYKLDALGSIKGGSVKKYGVWWDKGANDWQWSGDFPDAGGALAAIRSGLAELVTSAEDRDWNKLDQLGGPALKRRNGLRMKPLSLYFPNTFLPISSPDHLKHFLTIFGRDPHGRVVDRNQRLFAHLWAQSEFQGFDTLQMMRFLYDCFSLSDPAEGEGDEVEPDENTQPVVSPTVRKFIAATKHTRNVVLYGPPGTGKTWAVQQFAKGFDLRVKFVTFHQSYAYEEFVEGLRPQVVGDKLQYNVRPGVFRDVCDQARDDPAHQYLLVIDEMNRANVAKVFGELITLIEDDKRAKKANALRVALPYSGQEFDVPENLVILGTMNTADRSIALLDHALRRRFVFIEVLPDPDLLGTVTGVNLAAVLRELNKRVTRHLDRDHQIGHSYLHGITSTPDLHFAWYNRVVPLLREYFHGEPGRLRDVLGAAFVSVSGETDEHDTAEVRDLNEAEFLTALQSLSGNS